MGTFAALMLRKLNAMLLLGLLRTFALFFLVIGSAHAYQSVLDDQGWCGFDWLRPGGDFVFSPSALKQGVTLSASFRWIGDGTVPRAEGKTGEHAILGLVQGLFPPSYRVFCPASQLEEPMLNSPRHGVQRQGLHRRGVGILLAPVGLVIEVWNGDGTASTWSAEHGGCASSVPSGAISPPCVQLADRREESGDFLTPPAADFTITRGRAYWLSLYYLQHTSTRGVVEARLHQDAKDGPVLQQVRLIVELPAWASVEPIEVVLGRTGPEFPEHRYPQAEIEFEVLKTSGESETP
ncbi:MAG: hypothetical protein JNK52_07100 [Zoogloeaceae bacterium]|nr:hypothetical protein [Zoogloeaceae bacterium]